MIVLIGLLAVSAVNSDILKISHKEVYPIDKLISSIVKMMGQQLRVYTNTVYFISEDYFEILIEQVNRAYLPHTVAAARDHDSRISYSYGLTLCPELPKEMVLKRQKYNVAYFMIEKNCEKAEAGLNIFITAEALNVVMFCRKDDDFYFYETHWYTEKRCDHRDSFIFHKIGNTSSGDLNLAKYLVWGTPNLKRCPIKIAMFNIPPAVISKGSKLTGWEIMILNITIAKLNGTPIYKLVDIKHRNTKDPAKVVATELQRYDILGGLLFRTSVPETVGFFSGHLHSQTLAIAPYIPKKHFSIISDIFPATVWILLGFNIFLIVGGGMCIGKFLLNHDFTEAFWNSSRVVYLFVDQHYPYNRSNKLATMAYLLVLVFAFFMTTMYRVSLAAKLTNHHEVNIIEKYSDIQSTDLKIFCRRYAYPRLIEAEAFLKNRLEILDYNISIFDIVHKIINQKDSIFMDWEEVAKYETKHLPLSVLEQARSIDSSLTAVENVFITRSNYHLGTHFSRLTTYMAEAGLIRKFKELFLQESTKVIEESREQPLFRPVRFNDIADAFKTITIGWCAAFIMLILEMIRARFFKKQETRMNMLEMDFKNVKI